MTTSEFKARILAALGAHFPNASIEIEEKRGIVISARAEIAAGELIQVYFNGITQKTSYALIRNNQRILGYDNRLSWHKHPADAPHTHQECAEPAPEAVIAEMREYCETRKAKEG